MVNPLDIAEQAARRGGEVLLQWRGRVKAREKGPRDLVTEADWASQHAIEELLLRRFPDHNFLGEEDPQQLAQLSAEAPCWVVDPLDGTTNFVHGMPTFAVSVALMQQGKVEVGVVYNPVSDECFRASRGGGAELNGEQIRASDCGQLSQAMVAASFSAQVSDDSAEVRRFVQVLTRCQALRRLGSAALNLCYVAAGRLDAYWATSVKAWDMAAGALLIEEAGGVVTQFDGGPWDVRRPEFTAAATPPLHAELQGALRLSK